MESAVAPYVAAVVCSGAAAGVAVYALGDTAVQNPVAVYLCTIQQELFQLTGALFLLNVLYTYCCKVAAVVCQQTYSRAAMVVQ